MNELPGKIRVQDAALANMVSIAAVIEYLDSVDPGSRAKIEARAKEIARAIKTGMEQQQADRSGEAGETGKEE